MGAQKQWVPPGRTATRLGPCAGFARLPALLLLAALFMGMLLFATPARGQPAAPEISRVNQPIVVPPLKRRIDPALAQALREQPPLTTSSGPSLCGGVRMVELPLDVFRAGSCPGSNSLSYSRNDTSPFLYGDIYVIHIFVNDKNNSWSDWSLNPFAYTRDTEGSRVRDATEWMEDRAPSALNVDFNTSHNDEYSYYNATVDSTISPSTDSLFALVQVPEAIGYSDSDGDGMVLDDLLEGVRTLDGGGWENVLAIFHIHHDGRSYAYRTYPFATLFTGVTAAVYAHEMFHVFGASDEYVEDNTCSSGYSCTSPFPNRWIEPTYLNGNCALSSCGTGDDDCIMRGPAHGYVLSWNSVCDFTRGHIGWRDDDSDDVRDLQESAPWVEVRLMPPERTAEATVSIYGGATNAYRWTQIDSVQFRVDGGAWQSATPEDSLFDELFENFTAHVPLTSDGHHNVELRAHNAAGVYQTCTWAVDIERDRTGPGAPVVSSSTHPQSGTWYTKRDIQLSWNTPADLSGVDGYSIALDHSATSDPDQTVDQYGTSKSYSSIADGRWYFHVRARDGLGNWGTTAHRAIRIDNSAPAIPVVDSPTHPTSSFASADPVVFTWSGSDAHSGVSGYAWRGPDMDPNGTVAPSSPSFDTTVQVAAPSPDGDHYFHVRSVDVAGNWGTVGHRKIRVDRTPPALSVHSSSHPDTGTWYASGNVTFAWEPVAPDLSGIAGYSYAIAEGNPSVTPDETVETTSLKSTSYSDLASGRHWFGVHALDEAGNWGGDLGASGIARVVVRVDRTDPDSVTNLHTTSHGQAIGGFNCAQSADPSVDVAWTAAADAHSGIGGYSVVWNQSATTGPTQTKTLGATVTSATSPTLADGTSWYVHIRAVDAVGNWDDHFATLGPFHIDTSPAGQPFALTVAAGNGVDTLVWRPPIGEEGLEFRIYRRLANESFGPPLAEGVTDTVYIDAWPSVQNGDVYAYAIAAVDSCEREGARSSEAIAEPEYESPGTGVRWTLATFADSSRGALRGSAPLYTMHGNVTIASGDTLDLPAGATVASTDLSGTKRLIVRGSLRSQGTSPSPVTLTGLIATSGAWGGVDCSGAADCGGGGRLRIYFAANGVVWDGGNPSLSNLVIERCSGYGIYAAASLGGTCTVQNNEVRDCGTGIYVFGRPNSITQVANNLVTGCSSGIAYDVNQAAPPPTQLAISTNQVLRQSGDGIVCGRGATNITVSGNTVLENLNGIVFNSETWLPAGALVIGNDVSGNSNAGIYTAQQASPICQNNRIVQNGKYGCYSKTDAYPIYTGNTITGSRYGVFVELSPAAVPDLGNPPTTPGQNRMDGHTLQWVVNNGGVPMTAIQNWWGSAQANPAAVIGGAGGVAWNPVWNVVNQAPQITLLQPSGQTTRDTLTLTWTDSDPDPVDDARINLYYDDDGLGLDGTQIAGASNLSEDDPANLYLWDTRPVPAGTYYVYGLISDDSETRTSYGPGTVTIQHPAIGTRPDTLRATAEPGASADETLYVRNSGSADLSAVLRPGAAWIALGDTAITVEPADSAAVVVTFDAEALGEGDYASSIVIESDDYADSLVTVVAELRVEKPEIAVEPLAIDFGGVLLDSTGIATLSILSQGSAPLRIEGVVASAPFSLAGASLPDTLAPGDTLAVEVHYTPTAPWARADTVWIVSNDSDEGVVAVPLAGIGLGPEIRIAAASHDFGSVAVSDTGLWAFDVANDGTTALSLTGASFDSSGFLWIAPALATSVPAGDSVTVTLAFAPAEVRAYASQLLLISTDADEDSVTLDLSGAGFMPAAMLSGAPVEFGTVRLGAQATATVHVHNTSAAALNVTGASAASPFAVTAPTFPVALPAADSIEITVKYQPIAEGSDADTLFVTTNTPTAATLGGALGGTGAAPEIEIAPTALDFGTVHADSSASLTLTVRNLGTWPLTVSSVTLSGGSHFAATPPLTPFVVSAGDSALVSVGFLGAPVGACHDTIWIACDDDDEAQVAALLDANAVAQEIGLYALSGATEPILEIEVVASGYDFGDVGIGSTAQGSFRIRNTGGHPLHITALGVTPAAFTLDTLTLPIEIQAGTFVPLALSFAPTSGDTVQGSVTVGSDDRETPSLVVALRGHGIEAVAGLTPDSLFATVFEGDSGSVSLRLTNAGDQSFAFRIRCSSEWLAITDTTGWVEGRDTLEVSVRIDATTAGVGLSEATLLVLTSDVDFDTLWVPVTLRVPRMRYAEHDVGAFRATVTDGGAFGFWDPDQQLSFGPGFVYPQVGDANHLYHGSVWVGVPSERVSDASYDFDFVTAPGYRLTVEGEDPQRSFARFEDAASPDPLGIEITQQAFAYASPDHDDFLAVRYTLRNLSGAMLDTLYVGLMADWDIGTASANEGRYETAHAAGYLYDPLLADTVYAGIAMLVPGTAASFHFIHHPSLVPYGVASDSLKFALMSDGVKDAATWESADWSMMMSAGPFAIANGDSQEVAFALVAGTGLESFRANADAARALATTGTPTGARPVAFFLHPARPNPSSSIATLVFDLPTTSPVRASVYDLQGRMVLKLADRSFIPGRHTLEWNGADRSGSPAPAGVYFCRVEAGGREMSRKLVRIR